MRGSQVYGFRRRRGLGFRWLGVWRLGFRVHVERCLVKAGSVLFVWFYMHAMTGYGLVHAGNWIDCFFQG